MSYPPQPKWAVYFGTVTLDDGSVVTYTAAQIATLYNLGADPYLAVPLVGASPFRGGRDNPLAEIRYYHLKPQTDGIYFDAKLQYNTAEVEQDGPDFDERSKDKWVHRKRVAYPDDDY